MKIENVTCPWCQKGTVVVEGHGEVKVSCRCHACGRFFQVDVKTMIATRGTAYKRPILHTRRC